MREDLPAHRLQQRPVPRGLRAHRLRELRGRHRGGRQAGEERPAGAARASCANAVLTLACGVPGGASAVGYGGSGGLRPSAAALLSRHRRHPHVLLRRQPRQPG